LIRSPKSGGRIVTSGEEIAMAIDVSDPVTAEPAFLTSKEAATSLRISLRTLFELTKSGQLPSARIGWRVLYRPESLREFAARAESREPGPPRRKKKSESGPGD
jgi:excisionase family DNA binding protein